MGCISLCVMSRYLYLLCLQELTHYLLAYIIIDVIYVKQIDKPIQYE